MGAVYSVSRYISNRRAGFAVAVSGVVYSRGCGCRGALRRVPLPMGAVAIVTAGRLLEISVAAPAPTNAGSQRTP